MMKKFHELFALLVMVALLPFRVKTWRVILFRKTKVRIYLDSGEHIDVLCEKWKIRVGDEASYSFENLTKSILISPSHIIAAQER
jgi:hypothetical protein